MLHIQKSSSSSVLSALRNQLLKELQCLVPRGVRKQLSDKKLELSHEEKHKVTDRAQVNESHADKETLEILQGKTICNRMSRGLKLVLKRELSLLERELSLLEREFSVERRSLVY